MRLVDIGMELVPLSNLLHLAVQQLRVAPGHNPVKLLDAPFNEHYATLLWYTCVCRIPRIGIARFTVELRSLRRRTLGLR